MKLKEGQIKILELKLKRYKISFYYKKDTEEIIIGKSTNLNQKLIIGIIFTSLAIISLLSIIFLRIPYGRIINYILSGGLGAFGLKKIYEHYSLKENSKEKIISEKGISIDNVFYPKEELLEIGSKMEFDEEAGHFGYLYIQTYRRKEKIITIFNQDYKFLKDDLTYFKKFFIEYLEK